MEVNPNDVPALEPPDGVVPNFINPPSIHHIQVALAISALTVSTIAVAARTFARARVLRKFDLNDCALLLSLAIMAAYVGLIISTGMYGQGKHQWDVRLTSFLQLLKFYNFLEILYSPMMFFAKYVVLRQIETIFLQHRYHSSRAFWILIWSNLIFYAALFFSFIFACVPRSKIWDPTVQGGGCIDTNAALISSSALNIISDTTILILPLVIIKNLQVPQKLKVKVGAVFAVGAFATVASIVRFYYTIELTRTKDSTFAIEPFAWWTEIEYATVVLVACFPAFPSLFRHIKQEGKRYLSHTEEQLDSISVRNLREPGGYELEHR
ncbi:hypothetical protein GGR55DRAFT_619212 [Xylaria sp. FL0064]|nr:hypothetical protein GGR55DRAFT_619212 [Xylaria sp. FL0064]